MTKERRTISIDEDVEEYLARDGVNASQLVNSLVQNHVTSGGDERAMLELRREQLRSDISELEGRIETKQEELDGVNERLSEYNDERNEVLAEARNTLDDTPLDADNPAIQRWAEKAGMDVQTFIDALSDER